jgi:hypothetical protein
LLIFGGYSGPKFENGDLTFVELDQSKTRLMIKESNSRGIKLATNQESRQSMVFQASDIKNDTALKLFSMDMASKQNDKINDDDHKKKIMKDKQIERLTFQHFKTFLPLPIRETSTLIKEFRLKKDVDKSEPPKSESKP